MGVRRILAGALSAPLLLLSACGGGDDSIADPPVSSAPPSTTPTHAPQQESAEHFIRRWADAEKRMENNGEASQYLALSKNCHPCQILAQTVRRYYQAGGFIHWAGWEIQSIHMYPAQGNGVAFAVKSISAPTTYKVSADGPVKHLQGGSITYVLRLEPRSGPFHLVGKTQLQQ